MDDNLESLDNTTLREKCIQYGLPNVPVTDSSRKVLIKRLRMSMGGGAEKVAKAREATPKKVLNTAAKVTPKKSQSRRTIAEAPLSKPEEKTSYVSRPAAEKKVNNVLLFSDFSTQQEEERPFQRAPSLTPSEKLAKSGVVTTSYSQETTVLEDEYEDDPYSSSSPRNTVRPLSSYQTGHGLAHPIGGFFKDTENQSTMTKTLDGNISRSSPAFNVPSYGIASATNYIGSERTYPRNTFSSLSQQKSEIIKPSLTRRYTEYTTVKDSGDDDDVEEVQTPYLSSFARSLERLKSGEVATLTPSAPIRKKTSLYGSRQGYGYNDIGPADDIVSGALRQFLVALEHKYQLKRAFAFFLVFVLVVFIYVFFIM